MQFYPSIPLALLGWCVLAALTILNTVDVFGQFRALRKNSARDYTYVGNDVPAELPGDFPPAAMILGYYDYYDLTADVEWASLVPEGGGWVRLGSEGRTFAVSQYHQFLCLDAIRKVYVEARKQFVDGEESAATDFSRADRCFDYLRQMLMCGGDLSVEWRIPHELATTNEGVLHKCRDWMKVRKAVEENYNLWKGK